MNKKKAKTASLYFRLILLEHYKYLNYLDPFVLFLTIQIIFDNGEDDTNNPLILPSLLHLWTSFQQHRKSITNGLVSLAQDSISLLDDNLPTYYLPTCGQHFEYFWEVSLAKKRGGLISHV